MPASTAARDAPTAVLLLSIASARSYSMEKLSPLFIPRPVKQKYHSKSFLILNFNPPFFLCLNTSFVIENYQPKQWNASYNKAFMVDWSLSDFETCHLKAELYPPLDSSILISRMTSSSVIIPYRVLLWIEQYDQFKFICWLKLKSKVAVGVLNLFYIQHNLKIFLVELELCSGM